MAKRSQDWNEGLAQDLRDKEFAQEFIFALMDDGVDLQEALLQTIRSYGVTEFAAACKIPEANIHRALKKGSNPTQRTLKILLKPFGLRLGAIRPSGAA